MTNDEAELAAREWAGQAGGKLLPQLTANELAGIVNEAIERAIINGPGVEPKRNIFFAYLAPTGELIPSTIRGESGDAESALKNGLTKYRYDFNKCQLVPVSVIIAAPSAPVQEELQKEIDKLRQSLEFYKRRCDVLQEWQSKMRDPERTIVCDVLANGHTLPPEAAGDRYKVAPVQAVPDGWKEAAIAWEVCASIHRQWAKGKDALFSTRQADFTRHADEARAMLAAAPQPPKECHHDGGKCGVGGYCNDCHQPANGQAVPDGMVLAPKEPTEKMLRAGWRVTHAAFMDRDKADPRHVYIRMLEAAAPQPPKEIGE